jgi:hypothetical protein
MQASMPKCGVETIPTRLHTNGRAAVTRADREDRLFIRHPPLPEGKGYGFEIPGHDHLENQSAHSEQLNRPAGYACDVLFNCKNGKHFLDHQIACLDMKEVCELELPNPNTIRKDRKGAIVKQADVYTFEVVHTPTSCLYPHCEILTKKNGVITTSVSSGFKTTVRMSFADLAEKNREMMNSLHAEEFPAWSRQLKLRTILFELTATVKAIYAFVADTNRLWWRKLFS